MKFETQELNEHWVVVCLDDNSVWEQYDNQEEAQAATEYYQDESDCKDYIRDELEHIVEQGPYRFERFSQNEMRDLIEQVADDGGY